MRFSFYIPCIYSATEFEGRFDMAVFSHRVSSTVAFRCSGIAQEVIGWFGKWQMANGREALFYGSGQEISQL